MLDVLLPAALHEESKLTMNPADRSAASISADVKELFKKDVDQSDVQQAASNAPLRAHDMHQNTETSSS